MSNSLLAQSAKLKKQADKILFKSDLVKILEKFGKVEFTGSYNYDLILNPDIDLYLVVDEPNKKITQDLVNQFIDQGFWNRIKYADFVNFPYPNALESLNKSFYIGLKANINDLEWKVDIWIVSAKQSEDFRYPWIKQKLDANTKSIILNLKNDPNRGSITSFAIYDAVLNNGVTSIEELK
ncbi:MAG: hypothetical protein G01um101416_584 [Microgenomates group bacterium Gr01-1014_16]|nr:MAG: hypothetical protein G01um101416_584 [Microgenomates group bacterium Gr01-1014_16]